jgi:aryl-alcohol dehydrogenase-like predicted oxidoreductase
MGDTGMNLRRRPLGSTGLMVGEIGFGAWAIGGGFNVGGHAIGYGEVRDEESLAALARAFALGVNFVDTADAYGMGRSESLIGRALKSSPRRVHVATKVGNVRRDPEPSRKDFSPAYMRQACELSLHRLGVTCLDLYQLHNPSREVILDGRTWETLRDLKHKGKIAHYGISIGDPEEGLLAIQHGEVETIQLSYSFLEQRAAAQLFPEAAKRGVGLIVREPLANGILSGKYGAGHRFSDTDHRRDRYAKEKLEQILSRVERLKSLARPDRTLAQAALKFALTPTAVSTVIPGAKTAAQVEENVAAALTPELSQEELALARSV